MVSTNGNNISFEEQGGYVFALVDDYQLFNTDELKSVNAIVIVSYTKAMTSHLITRIRTSREMELYLLPIFIVGFSDNLPIAIRQVIDGSVASTSEMNRLTEEVKRIKQNMQNFQ